MPVMPVTISRMLSGSTGLGFGSFDSGTIIGARISRGIRIGTASRNTEPQSKCSSRKPPTIGPSAAPAEKPEAHGNSDAALGRIHKDIADNRQGRRHEHRTENTEQGTGNHEHQCGGANCRERRKSQRSRSNR